MLRVEGISKSYRPPPALLRPLVRAAADYPVVALREVSLTVEAGEAVGLVGLNGAGKSTLLRIVGGLLDPDAGRVMVDGIDVCADPIGARCRVGLVLGDERGLYWRLTARQNLELFGVLGGLRRPAARARTAEVLDQVGLGDDDKLVFGFSSGMRTRLNLARALLTDPGLIVLDEPARSLDPLAASDVCDLLAGLVVEGRSILLSSHRPEELTSLCRKVVILVGGEVRYLGPVPGVQGADLGQPSGLVALLRAAVAGG